MSQGRRLSLSTNSIFAACLNDDTNTVSTLLTSDNVDPDFRYSPFGGADGSIGGDGISQSGLKLEECVGWTPLMFASYCGSMKVVKFLLKHGARVTSKSDSDKKTALHLAASNGNWEVGSVLIDAGADTNAQDDRRQTPLHMTMYMTFWGKRASDDASATVTDDTTDALGCGYISEKIAKKIGSKFLTMAKTLLEHGSRASIQNIDNWTAMDVVIAQCIDVNVESARADILCEMVDLLLRRGGSTKQMVHNVILHTKCNPMGERILKLFIKHKVDMNREVDGLMPLNVVVQQLLGGHVIWERGNAVMFILFNGGANPNQRVPHRHNDALFHMIFKECDPSTNNVCYRIVESLCKRPNVDVNVKNQNGETPLLLLLDRGLMENLSSVFIPHHLLSCLKSLLAASADVNADDVNGRSPIGIAIDRGHEKIIDLLLAVETCDVNKMNKDGATYLHRIVTEFLMQPLMPRQLILERIAHRIIHCGASVNVACNGSTPLALALRSGYPRVVRLFLQKPGHSKKKMKRAIGKIRKAFSTKNAIARGVMPDSEPPMDDKDGAGDMIGTRHSSVTFGDSIDGDTSKVDATSQPSQNLNRSPSTSVVEDEQDEDDDEDDSPMSAVLFEVIHELSTTNPSYERKLFLENMISEIIDGVDKVVSPPGRNILDLAVNSGLHEVSRLLLRKGAKPSKDLLVKIIHKESEASLSYDKDFLTAIIKEIIVTRSSDINAVVDGQTAIHAALQHGNEEIFKLLCDYGADIQVKDSNGLTPLIKVLLRLCSRNCTSSQRLFLHNAALSLISHGADINANHEGVFALSLCLEIGKDQLDPHINIIIDEILNRKAVIDMRNVENMTPLCWCIREMGQGHRLPTEVQTFLSETVGKLLSRGADVNYRVNGKTLLRCALDSGDEAVCRLLVDAHADLQLDAPLFVILTELCNPSTAHSRQTFLKSSLDLLLDHGSDPNASVNGQTPLGIAIAAGSGAIVKTLLAHGARFGRNLLFEMIQELSVCPGGNRQAFLETSIRQLVCEGANINQASGQNTVLSYALKCGNFDIFSLLIEQGADIDLTAAPTEPTCLYAALRELASDTIPNSSAGNQRKHFLIQAIKVLIEARADPNVTQNGVSALSLAVKAGRPDIVRLMLSKDADVSIPGAVVLNENGQPETNAIPTYVLAQAVALMEGKTGQEADDRDDIVRMIIDAGADINAPGGSEYPGGALETALMQCNRALVDFLIDNGADPNGPPGAPITPLGRIANAIGSSLKVDQLLEMAAALLEAGAHVDILHPAVSGCAGTGAASIAGQKFVRTLIEGGADVNRREPSSNYETPLHVAAKNGLYKLSEVILEHGGDLNIQDAYGQTALMTAAIAGRTDVLRLLLEKGANPNVVGTIKHPLAAPIHIAAANGAGDAVSELIHRGANVNLRGPNQRTPLHMILSSSSSDVDSIVQSLIEDGHADPDLRDANGDSALSLAAKSQRRDVVRYLLKKGALPTTQDIVSAIESGGKTGRDIAMDIINAYKSNTEANAMIVGDDCVFTSEEQQQLLRTSLRLGIGASMFEMLSTSANVDTISWGGSDLSPPLKTMDFIFGDGFDNITLTSRPGIQILLWCAYYRDLESLEMACSAGADPCAVDGSGRSVLHYIALWGGGKGSDSYIPVAEFIIQAGCETSLKDYSNRTAMDIAASLGHIDVVVLLRAGMIAQGVSKTDVSLSLTAAITIATTSGYGAMLVEALRSDGSITEVLPTIDTIPYDSSLSPSAIDQACISKGIGFADATFIPSLNSLLGCPTADKYTNSWSESCTNIEWYRLKDMSIESILALGNFDDITIGAGGGLWVLTVLTGLVNAVGGDIRKMFSKNENLSDISSGGCYVIQLPDPSGLVSVLVDDWIPCAAGATLPAFLTSTSSRAMEGWSLLVLKAAAKRAGSYDALRNMVIGSPASVINAATATLDVTDRACITSDLLQDDYLNIISLASNLSGIVTNTLSDTSSQGIQWKANIENITSVLGGGGGSDRVLECYPPSLGGHGAVGMLYAPNDAQVMIIIELNNNEKKINRTATTASPASGDDDSVVEVQVLDMNQTVVGSGFAMTGYPTSFEVMMMKGSRFTLVIKASGTDSSKAKAKSGCLEIHVRSTSTVEISTL